MRTLSYVPAPGNPARQALPVASPCLSLLCVVQVLVYELELLDTKALEFTIDTSLRLPSDTPIYYDDDSF